LTKPQLASRPASAGLFYVRALRVQKLASEWHSSRRPTRLCFAASQQKGQCYNFLRHELCSIGAGKNGINDTLTRIVLHACNMICNMNFAASMRV